MSRPHLYSRPIDQEKHIAYLKNRAQAKLRGEPFELTIEEYFEFWQDDLWLQRGREGQMLVLTRKDTQGPWSKKNCFITTRLAVLIRTNALQRGVKRAPYKKRVKINVS